MLRRVIDAGRHAGIGVSVCGEMAGDPAYTLVLLALGADELSMGGTSIPTVKQIVRSSSLGEARLLLDQALSIDSDDEVESWVRAEMVRRYPDVFESYSAELPIEDDESEPREEFSVT
jgi:phosphotransferase system enzyme I (PtsI)